MNPTRLFDPLPTALADAPRDGDSRGAHADAGRQGRVDRKIDVAELVRVGMSGAGGEKHGRRYGSQKSRLEAGL